MGDLSCAKHCCCATGASNSIDQQQNANANNAGTFASIGEMGESCQDLVLWHGNFWLHCMANVVANVLSSVYFPCQPSCQCTALVCNATQCISTVCALGASDSDDQQCNPSQHTIAWHVRGMSQSFCDYVDFNVDPTLAVLHA